MSPGASADTKLRALRPDEHVALVHHWLVSRRGGERVLEVLSRLVPGATLYTLVHDRRACPAPAGISRVVTSPLQQLPAAARSFRALLPWHAAAWRSLDLSGHRLVLSSDAALAKTVRVPPGATHICYCYSPPRWAWDLSELYLKTSVPALARPAVRAVLARVRAADLRGAQRVDRFLAISEHVRQRIARCYGRESEVLYPPVDTEFFVPDRTARERAGQRSAAPYLLLGEAVPYKRFEIALEACRRLKRPLVVAGGGRRLAALAARIPPSPVTSFVPDPDDAAVRTLYRQARALLFPGEEDFGLVPVEAMACGRPVIALARGGATETVVDGVTGCLFGADAGDEDAQTSGDMPVHSPHVQRPEAESEIGALCAAILRFERELEPHFDPEAARARAEHFSTARFLRELSDVLGISPPAAAPDASDARPATALRDLSTEQQPRSGKAVLGSDSGSL